MSRYATVIELISSEINMTAFSIEEFVNVSTTRKQVVVERLLMLPLAERSIQWLVERRDACLTHIISCTHLQMFVLFSVY